MKRKHLLFLIMLLLAGFQSWAQQRVSGTVTDEDGGALIGVNVLEEGTQNGTVTDVNGSYEISVSQGATLLFSLIGYQNAAVTADNAIVNVVLTEGVELSEVVVTALGISREKKALGYAMTELNSEDFNEAKETNIVNQLAGRVAGVNITKSSAGPGSGTRVIIRGNNSLGGNNQPLYVVDGVPVDNSGFGTANGAGTANYRRTDYGTGISDINPDDIENISVLKGPNAAALYGSRASNGVILITTKKGKKGKGLGVSYSTHYTTESPMLLPEYQNEYGMGSQGLIDPDLASYKTNDGSWGPKMDGSSQLYWDGGQKAFSAQPDNISNFFRNGSNFINTLAFDGGNDFGSFRFSYTNTQANSILENSGLKRHNFNLRAGANLTDKLALDAKITYFTQNANNRPDQGTEGITAYVYNIPRNVSIADLKDNYRNDDYSSNSYNSLGANPFFVLYANRNEDRRNRIQGFTKVTYKFTDHLSVFARVGMDNIDQNIESVKGFGHWYWPQGSVNFSNYKTAETNMDFLAMYNRDLTDDINFGLNFGGNMMRATNTSMGMSGTEFKIPTLETIASTEKDKRDQWYSPLGEKRINSLYGAAQFAYSNFAYLDLTARNDWSSTLPEANRSYFYPSASVSFVLSELINVNMIDYSKLRFSYAQVGSDTDPYQLVNVFTLDGDGYLGETTLSTSTTQLNPDLKPEITSSFEVGYETRMFDNRFYADLTYYDIRTKDLITTVPVPPATGYSSKLTNVGSMTNKGIEILFGFVPVKTNNFNWDISFNLARNTNKLVELDPETGLNTFVFTTTNSGNVIVRATVDGALMDDDGNPIAGGYGDIYGTDLMRNENGDLVVTAEGIPRVASGNVYLGNYQPDWTGGMFNNIRFKDFTLKFLIDARIGGQLYSGSDAGMDGSGTSVRTLTGPNGETRDQEVIVDGVINTGTDEDPVWTANTTAITVQEYYGSVSGIASQHIYDQTNVRLRELSLNYDLPKSMLSGIGIKGVSIGLVGRNLMFFMNKLGNFDPETSYSTSNFAQGVLFYNLPTTKSIGVNLNIKF